MTVLVLAGTTEATALITALVERNLDVIASLAGRTSAPRQLPCLVRTGGFGGVDGLVDELRARAIDVLVDATHAFADEMPAHARDAAAIAGVAHVRLVRPAWTAAEGDRWTEVEDFDAAAAALGGLPSRRALLTVGRQELATFGHLRDIDLVVRAVEPPGPGPWAAVVLGRGPFAYDDELELLRSREIDAIVTRNSGGDRAKLDAARDHGARVVMVRRPSAVDIDAVHDVDAAVQRVLAAVR